LSFPKIPSGLGITERCAFASSRPTIWRHCRYSDPGWIAPPIRPDMIFGKDTNPEAAKADRQSFCQHGSLPFSTQDQNVVVFLYHRAHSVAYHENVHSTKYYLLYMK
jgi:hypothetical protein